MQSGLERGAWLLGASDLLAVANLNAADVLRHAPAVFYHQSSAQRRGLKHTRKSWQTTHGIII